MLESLFNSVAGRNFICERLLLFVLPENTITSSSGEFGLDEFSTECKVSIFLKRTEAVARRCPVKKVFLEISQNSLENTSARASFLIKWQYRTPLVAASERNNFIQSNAAKDKKSFFNISINIPARFLNSNLHLVS